jgi:hypothetical protein
MDAKDTLIKAGDNAGAAEQGDPPPHRCGRHLPRPRRHHPPGRRAVLAEQDDEWTESRRYMGLEILAACGKAAQPDTGQNNISEAGLTVEAIPA